MTTDDCRKRNAPILDSEYRSNKKQRTVYDLLSESETNSHSHYRVRYQLEINNEDNNETSTSEALLPLVSYFQESDPKTPRRMNKLSKKDTPRAERVQETPAYKSSYVNSQRDKLLKSIEKATFEWSVEDFLTQALPPLQTKLNVDDVFNECMRIGLYSKQLQSEGPKWNELLDTPEGVKIRETDIYNKPLRNIFKKITTIAKELSGITHKSYLYADGNNTYWSERVIDIKPDALIFLENSEDGCPRDLNWYNVVCSLEFKKSDKLADRFENGRQIIHSLHSLMSADPCRRFTLGITIEGTSMRIWMLSFSFLLTSEPFDIATEPETFIRVVLSLIFSDKVDLGWDAAIKAIWDEGKRKYIINIEKERYVTENIITDVKAEGIYSTGTRIFRVYNQNDKLKEHPLILKDYWPATVYDTEVETRSKILDNILDKEEHKLVEKALLTPINSEKVLIGDKEDNTETVILRGKSPTKLYTFKPPKEKCGQRFNAEKRLCIGSSSVIGSLPRDSSKESDESIRTSIFPRIHCRIVYKEFATPYQELKSIKDMLLVLEHSIDALRVIHKAGWVHRDLSPANLYLYTDPDTGVKRGIIGDLEYAKKAGTEASSDVRSGSPFFMAVETIDQQYIFMDVKKAESYNSSSGIFANYLHDLESIWWIIIWTLLKYEGDTRDPINVAHINKRLDHNRRLFSRGARMMRGRRRILKEKAFIDQDMVWVPEYFQPLKQLATSFREYPFDAYYKEENELDMTKTIKVPEGSVHLSLLSAFKEFKMGEVCVSPIDYEKLRLESKSASEKAKYTKEI